MPFFVENVLTGDEAHGKLYLDGTNGITKFRECF